MLPTGLAHLVVRLSDEPLQVFQPGTATDFTTIGGAMVGGARSGFYVRTLSAPSASVGAVLRPGAAALLFGLGADELAERHTPLHDLIGPAATRLRDRLGEADGPDERLHIMEAFLAARLPIVQGMHPAVAQMFQLIHRHDDVGTAVRRSELSHRHFIAQFKRSAGLTPKTYQRIRRFQLTLALLRSVPGGAMAELAARAGYADQSHFNRDFLSLAGMTPRQYLLRRPAQANHVTVSSR